MNFPLTVSMTPSFICEGDWLLRAQLRCLSEQTSKDFDVYLIDPHYSKRVNRIPELAALYKLNIVHIPYSPNRNVAKRMDCAVFNAAYCYSESPRIVRYSCWRFVRPDFTKCCLESKSNVDFFFHNCQPPTIERKDFTTWHDREIWNFGSDEVHWDKVPKTGQPGCAWTPESDHDQPETLFPTNCYGNYMVKREDWVNLNGVNEGPFSTAHFEDMDFCLRARNAGLKCSRKAHALYRLHHAYGSYSGRANIPPDNSLKPNCPQCEAACLVLEPNRFDLKRRISSGEIEEFKDQASWICRSCGLCGPIYHKDASEYTAVLESRKITKAFIFPTRLIGRNLRILTADMDGKPLAEKVRIYNDSWTNERYYQP